MCKSYRGKWVRFELGLWKQMMGELNTIGAYGEP